MTRSKVILQTSLSLKDFHFTGKKPERKILKSKFLSKKNSQMQALVISFFQYNSLIDKAWVDLINKREYETEGFLGKIG